VTTDEQHSGLDEERILEAIRLEWRLAWAELPRREQDRLRIPGFEIGEARSYWGKWHGDRRKIVLGRELLSHTSWPCVREVLRHEMAHQVADEVFHAGEELHGPRFREACRLLRADPRASADTPSIYQRIARDAREDGKTATVRKLLALAASPNPHEAEAAMLKAHELMVRHNIDPEHHGEREYVSLCLGEPVARLSIADDYLAGLLRDFYFVETVVITIALVARGRQGKILEVSGTAENVRMASYIFDFLRRSIDEQLRARRIRSKRSQKDYAVGFLKGVSSKLETQRTAFTTSIPNAMALIRAGDAGVQAYFRERYPRLSRRYHRARRMDETAYHAGMADGRKVVIHKPVETGAASRGRLLPV